MEVQGFGLRVESVGVFRSCATAAGTARIGSCAAPGRSHAAALLPVRSSCPSTRRMLLVPLLCAALGAVLGACPAPQEIAPCTCRTVPDDTGGQFSLLTCAGLRSEERLAQALSRSRSHDIHELELVGCSLGHFPHDAFQGTRFEILSMRDCGVSSLSETGRAFEGLEGSLGLVEIRNCSFVNDWDWHQMAHLDRLREIQVADSELLYVTEGVARIAHLDIRALSFQKNSVKFLSDFVFSPFEDIHRIGLDNNDIQDVKRTMFPRPASSLWNLGLSYNRLGSLPGDLFADMPRLRSLYLAGNPLRTLDERTFAPVWPQLRLLLFSATPLSCDCRITWLVLQDNSNKDIFGECHSPSQFKGRKLFSVKPKELWC